MTYQTIKFNGFNENNTYMNYFITLKNNTYNFILRWSNYCNCAFLTINDTNGKPIISSIALVTNLKIRNNKLPYLLAFLHKDSETYEPNLDNLSNEYYFMYDDELEVT